MSVIDDMGDIELERAESDNTVPELVKALRAENAKLAAEVEKWKNAAVDEAVVGQEHAQEATREKRRAETLQRDLGIATARIEAYDDDLKAEKARADAAEARLTDAEALVRRMGVELCYANSGAEIPPGSAEGEGLIHDAEQFIGCPVRHWAEASDLPPWEKKFLCGHEKRADRLAAALREIVTGSTEEQTEASRLVGCSRCMGTGEIDGEENVVDFRHDEDCPVAIAAAALKGESR